MCVWEVSLHYTQCFSTFNDASFRSRSKVRTESPWSGFWRCLDHGWRWTQDRWGTSQNTPEISFTDPDLFKSSTFLLNYWAAGSQNLSFSNIWIVRVRRFCSFYPTFKSAETFSKVCNTTWCVHSDRCQWRPSEPLKSHDLHLSLMFHPPSYLTRLFRNKPDLFLQPETSGSGIITYSVKHRLPDTNLCAGLFTKAECYLCKSRSGPSINKLI